MVLSIIFPPREYEIIEISLYKCSFSQMTELMPVHLEFGETDSPFWLRPTDMS